MTLGSRLIQMDSPRSPLIILLFSLSLIPRGKAQEASPTDNSSPPAPSPYPTSNNANDGEFLQRMLIIFITASIVVILICFYFTRFRRLRNKSAQMQMELGNIHTANSVALAPAKGVHDFSIAGPGIKLQNQNLKIQQPSKVVTTSANVNTHNKFCDNVLKRLNLQKNGDNSSVAQMISPIQLNYTLMSPSSTTLSSTGVTTLVSSSEMLDNHYKKMKAVNPFSTVLEETPSVHTNDDVDSPASSPPPLNFDKHHWLPSNNYEVAPAIGSRTNTTSTYQSAVSTSLTDQFEAALIVGQGDAGEIHQIPTQRHDNSAMLRQLGSVGTTNMDSRNSLFSSRGLYSRGTSFSNFTPAIERAHTGSTFFSYASSEKPLFSRKHTTNSEYNRRTSRRYSRSSPSLSSRPTITSSKKNELYQSSTISVAGTDTQNNKDFNNWSRSTSPEAGIETKGTKSSTNSTAPNPWMALTESIEAVDLEQFVANSRRRPSSGTWTSRVLTSSPRPPSTEVVPRVSSGAVHKKSPSKQSKRPTSLLSIEETAPTAEKAFSLPITSYLSLDTETFGVIPKPGSMTTATTSSSTGKMEFVEGKGFSLEKYQKEPDSVKEL
ncbi:hypothetical protein HK098_001124 [Nowakowskiella sp. JEL0407]|nr:hypothetical protein HK098_001124 [Nowakowskiella sp. JEL0407]